ncbi:MAG: SMC-Scp complex subunit ScpB [Pseudomonadota bacterium]
MAKPRKAMLDRELADLPQASRWREWMRRIEAALFASATPLDRAALRRIVGDAANVDLLIEDLRAELSDRPYDVVAVGTGWMMRSRPAYAEAIRAVADTGPQTLDLSDRDSVVLAAIAYRQPVTRADLKQIFGKEIPREQIGRLSRQDLIAAGPRSPRPGAPYTFVTTERFLQVFGLTSLRDLPDLGQLADAGIDVSGD